jgi:chromosome partitioning protein
MRILSIINLKGGVAKTVSSTSIAYILAWKGYKVLLVDNDKQGDASRGVGSRTQDGEGIDRLMVERMPNMQRLIKTTEFKNLSVITANMRLLMANKEVMMDQTRPQHDRLKKALDKVREEFDICIIDNAPDINISTINALAASDDVLIPIEIDDNTTEGMRELLEQIGNTREDLNPSLQNVRCFVTKFDKWNEAHRQGLEFLKERTTYPFMQTRIRFSRKVAESTYARKPLPLYSPYCAASRDYMELAAEYLQMIGGVEHGI